jgi:hypothetical protein
MAMKKLITILVFISIFAATWPAPSVSAASVFPTISIVSVEADKSVTIRTHNYPANDTFVVTMGKMGTRGVGGVKVDTIQTGSGGSFTATFNIPASLKGLYQIAIRLESPTSKYFSYNWFYNNTSGTGGTPTGSLPPGVYPTFSIKAVTKDTNVTIVTKNLPKDDRFVVTMGKMGTRGVGGVTVDTIDSGNGGTQELTFKVPDSLKGQYQIAIRLESKKSGYFAYNWFYNNTTGDGGTPPGGGTGGLPSGVYPTFSIQAVVRDQNVTILTKNLPANDSFVVTMGLMGTRGVNGAVVTTIDTGSGGAQTLKFDIPASLKGQYQIAIRLESKKSGYFAYNWFYNNTTN